MSNVIRSFLQPNKSFITPFKVLLNTVISSFPHRKQTHEQNVTFLTK